MSRMKVPLFAAAAVIGRHVTTLRRWRSRRARSEALARPRGLSPRRAAADVRDRAAGVVRTLRGLVGAEALRRSIPGLTRREAAAIKAATRCDLERERRAGAAQVVVTAPNVLRGLDDMQLRADAHLVVAADGAVPYRTSWEKVLSYDGRAVAAVLERDFARNGAPLVIRFDRAKQHDVGPVRAVLDEYGVVALHGPPHRPQYYGQLERQNREHRAWLRADGPAGIDRIDEMMAALNGVWRRRRLGWWTAAEVWNAKPQLRVDRTELRKEVTENAIRLASTNDVSIDLGWRLAVEMALANRGLLRIVPGGWC